MTWIQLRGPRSARGRHRAHIPALILLLVLGLLLGSATVRAESPPVGGIYALISGGVAVSSAILDDPLIAGVTIRSKWQSVEIRDNEYDWSYFDEQIARVAAAGKPVFLKVTAGGVNVPPFLMSRVATFSFEDSHPYVSFDGTLTIPTFWDPVFLSRKMALIEAMGRRFANHPAVLLVGVHCANAMTDDWNVPHTNADIEQWRAIGYTSAKLINACKETIVTTMRAFPHQYVVLPVNNNGKLDKTGNYVSKTVVDWALQQYPARFLLAKHNLSATTPTPSQVKPSDAWDIVRLRRGYAVGQMLWYVTDDKSCRMNGGVKPCNPVTVLRRAVTTGDSYGMPLIEFYAVDLRNPALDAVIDLAADLLP